MGAFPAEKFEFLEQSVSEMVRVGSITKLVLSSSFYDDYYLKVIAYCQDYLILNDYQSTNQVPYLEQRCMVGHKNVALLALFPTWDHASSFSLL
jgi:hypothetical protein